MCEKDVLDCRLATGPNHIYNMLQPLIERSFDCIMIAVDIPFPLAGLGRIEVIEGSGDCGSTLIILGQHFRKSQ